MSIFPTLSATEKVTVVALPTGNRDPDTGIDVILATPEASDAVGDDQVTGTTCSSAFAFIVKSNGQLFTVGGVVSTEEPANMAKREMAKGNYFIITCVCS